MKLIVGLGNPTAKYQKTRHNAGFMVLDKFGTDFGININENKFNGLFGRGFVWDCECLLFKPLSYMNLSGKAVREIISFFKIQEDQMIVIHDDIDVPFGVVRSRCGGGDGGHKGIRSVIDYTGFKNFYRIKLGIGKPNELENRNVQDVITEWVLSEMSSEELTVLLSSMYEGVLLRLKNIFKYLSNKGKN